MVLSYFMMNCINQGKDLRKKINKEIWESNLDKMTTMFEDKE